MGLKGFQQAGLLPNHQPPNRTTDGRVPIPLARPGPVPVGKPEHFRPGAPVTQVTSGYSTPQENTISYFVNNQYQGQLRFHDPFSLINLSQRAVFNQISY